VSNGARFEQPILKRALAAGAFLEELPFGAVAGLDAVQWLDVFTAFQRSSSHMLNGSELRAGAPATADLLELCSKSLVTPTNPSQAKNFFQSNFTPVRICSEASGAGFLTGYYEPVIDADVAPSDKFKTPVLAFPDHLGPRGAARLLPRSEIEQLRDYAEPLVWVRDPIEAFMVQVQGSARLRMADGRLMRLVYDGRNGHSYTSIGRILIDEGRVDEKDMSLEGLKRWFRDAGQDIGQLGRDIMWRNASFIFFRLEPAGASGPIGGQGIALQPLVSLAVDRNIWPYGTPVLLSADLSAASSGWEGFCRVLIAQDTGSAIIGPARGDLYVGSGDQAGTIAGRVRHKVEFVVLAPKAQVVTE
jgi:membrane-bound lytic murein transglycosylase A